MSQAAAPSRIEQRLGEASPVRPTAEELAQLGRFERFAFRWCDAFHIWRPLRWLSQKFLYYLGVLWVFVCTRNLIHIEGAENLRRIPRDASLLLCSNHRSFFDMYVLACWMMKIWRRAPNLCFPVRSTFFYERPLGMFVNMVMAMFAMYPPIFREAEKRGFNSYALARMVELAKTPGVMMGFHPEGMRNKTGDPYSFLPAQPGIGQIIYESRATVLPVFINGLLPNNLPKQIWGNFNRRGSPLCIVFGEPIDLSGFYAKSNRLRTHKEIADHTLAGIAKLGAREREMRVEVERAGRAGPQIR